MGHEEGLPEISHLSGKTARSYQGVFIAILREHLAAFPGACAGGDWTLPVNSGEKLRATLRHWISALPVTCTLGWQASNFLVVGSVRVPLRPICRNYSNVHHPWDRLVVFLCSMPKILQIVFSLRRM